MAETVRRIIGNDLARFTAKVRVDLPSGCWLWSGAHTQAGYAAFRVKDRTEYGHRWSFEQVHGEVPDGLELDHLCRNRGCVNPFHLEAVTHTVNVQRGDGGERSHCPKGHLYDGANLYVGPTGGKRCRQCAYESKVARRRAGLRD